MRNTHWLHAAALSGALMLSAGATRADTIIIDSATAGTVYDGVLDGVPPFPPPGEGPDGDGDSQNTGLAVALKAGVVEERGIAEFPLSSLAGLSAGQIANATLTFKIDDVIGLFWQGAAFDNTAADTIYVFTYSGNGAVTLADFQNVVGAPAGVVDTTPFGVITDATLGSSGALQFQVDVTTRLQALLTASASHMGIVFATDDENSATSLDNLGVAGAVMPFLTITTVPLEPPVWDGAQLGCQKAISKNAAKLAKTLRGGLTKCFDGVLSATSKGKPLTDVTAKCVAALAPASATSKVGKAIDKLEAAIADKCADLAPANVASPCASGATTFTQVATCVVNAQLTTTSNAVGSEYGAACALITAVGLDADYPALCD